MAGIYYVDYFLPDLINIEDCISTYPKDWLEQYQSLEDFHAVARTPQYGFDKISIGNPKSNLLTLSDLMSKFFSQKNIDPNTISHIISTDSWNNFLSADVDIMQYLQKSFNLNNAGIFSIEQQCGASCLAIGLASILAGKKINNSIIILSNNTRDWVSRLGPGQIVGDGAGIIVVSNRPAEYEIIDYDSASSGYGSYTNYCKAAKLFVKDEISEENRAFYTNIHHRAVKFIKKFLKKHNLLPKDIYMMIVQSINHVTYTELYAKPLDISSSQMYLRNIPCGGHLGNVDMARNFKDFIENDTPPKGAYILIYASAFNGIGDMTNNAVLVQRT